MLKRNKSVLAGKVCASLIRAIMLLMITVTGVLPAHAATFVVTSAADAGAGTLRQAITDANGSDGPHTIDLTGVSTITLESALPELATNIALQGPANKVVIQRNSYLFAPRYRILTVSSGADVTLTNLTIQKGVGELGGGIQNSGSLTITTCRVSNNYTNPGSSYATGGGITNYGTLHISQSTVSNNDSSSYQRSETARGGGIANFGTMTITACAVVGNTVSGTEAQSVAGGGIYNEGTATITNSTIHDNEVASLADPYNPMPGALFAHGGGIFNYGPLSVSSSTIAGNRIITFSYNDEISSIGGGGLAGSATLSNTIVAGNTVEATAVMSTINIAGIDIGGTVNSLGHNLVGNPQGVSGLVASDLKGVDPKLAPLQDNGGPTFTMALLEGSPAINGGSNANAPATDQRGVDRPQPAGSIADIGAYELVAGNFSLSGYIKTSSGVPIVGVTVTRSGSSNPIKTDANGLYIFTSLTPNVYTITPSLTGFTFSPASRQLGVSSTYRGANFMGTRTPTPSVVSGRISDASGAGLQNISVAISPVPAGVASPVMTNSSGYYSFRDVPNGSYQIIPTQSETNFTPYSRTVQVSGDVSGLNFVSSRGYIVRGRIADRNGVGLMGVTVTCRSEYGEAIRTGVTNNAGYFQIRDVPSFNYMTGYPTGDYTLTPSRSGTQFSPPTRNISVIYADVNNQNFVGISGHTVTGRISTFNGVAIDGVEVRISDRSTPVLTNNAGYFTFYDVPDGQHTLTPSRTGHIFTPSSKNITVNGDLHGQNFIGATGYTIIGRIATSNNVSIEGVEVRLSGRSTPVLTNNAGYYVLRDVPNGQHTITPSKSGYNFTPSSRTATVNGANVAGQNFVGSGR